jgi:hypothetical protein
VPALWGGVPTANNELQLMHRVGYRAEECFGSCFRASGALMQALVAEMDEQGMFAEDEDARGKLLAQGGELTFEELDRMLSVLEWPFAPTTEVPTVHQSAADKRIAEHELKKGSDYMTPSQTVMAMSSVEWMSRWLDWLVFLNSAMQHGGVRVG